MNNNVYIIDTKHTKYNNNVVFNPSKKYPEGLNINISSDPLIYDKVRELFLTMKLDKKNIGTDYWNPFSEFIRNGNTVVIKPNLVKHINSSISGTTDSLITNFSIIRPIIDYCIIALKGTGRIILGDAPVQECIFEEVVNINNLKSAINIYNKKGYKIELIDFRKHNNPELKCQIVSLGEDSSLAEVDDYCDKYAITNYNLKNMHKHHQKGIHEYLIPEDILEADVVINLPKPKTHRKAGITACMKNFVGINSKKEYLPHHRNGSIKDHGDEFPENNLIKKLESKIKNYTYLNNFFLKIINKFLRFVLKLTKKNKYMEGSWYGNDTIWRTILDINKIITYADKHGNMTNQHQRIIFNLADMIISGEKEGPLLPSNKPVGYLVCGFNQLDVDDVICGIMGFDSHKIKYINNGYKLTKYPLSKNKYKVYDHKGPTNISKYQINFEPTNGWKDFLIK